MAGDKYSQILIDRILFLCDKRGLSVRQLAAMSGLAHSSIENIILRRSQSPTLKTVHKIATAFCMTPAEFLDFKELNDYSFADEEQEIDEA